MDHAAFRALASLLGLGDPPVEVSETEDMFGSPFRVSEAAALAVGVAVAAVAAFHQQRAGEAPAASVDGRHAAAAFHSERLVRLLSRPARALWDPVSGNYPTADGWVRLHANLTSHREAVLRVLGVDAAPSRVATAVAGWRADDLELAVIEAGGVAARMRTREEYVNHPHHHAVRDRPVIDLGIAPQAAQPRRLPTGGALDGVRVLDLTRVIAGPVAGRFLASFGADVLRVDPPLDDGLLLEIDTGGGKRRTAIDLRRASDRRRFEHLVADADVLLEGFRPGVLTALGYPDVRLRERCPRLVIGHLSAYGDRGPWRDRRGFDSVVQVATGLAHACGFDPATGPGKLPAQALDHASGYLLAAGLVAGLRHQQRDGQPATVHVSLARTGEWLADLGTQDRPAREPTGTELSDLLDRWSDTAWGAVEYLRPPGRVGDRPARWVTPPIPRTDGPDQVSGR